jgi:ankyrin repeat protein
MKSSLLFCFTIVVCALAVQKESGSQTTLAYVADPPNQAARAVGEIELRTASAKAIKLIQHSQVIWYQRETCTSCHHQLLPEIPLNLARERGIPLDEKVARETTGNAFAFLMDLDGVVQGYDYIDVAFDAWELTAAHRAGIRPSTTTAVEAQFIASRQLSDGSWPTIDERPPQSYSTFTTTAVCANALEQYLPAQLKGEKETRVRLAREWLLKTQPRTTEDRTFQLFGLHWTDADKGAIKRAARQLLDLQREDGGWSQLPELGSDAYATGEVLVALHEAAGVPAGDSAYQRGLQFLLKTQQADGSWQVRSRLHPPAPVSPPYVNTEFPPFQHDQFVSIMATNWATAALLHAIPAQSMDRMSAYQVAEFAPAEQGEWIRLTLSGDEAQLRKLLDAGMKPDSKTAQGTTALMLAARDINKVKLLIDRGADVNARAASGLTPLMVASRSRGNSEVVRLLLKKGARPNADKGVEVRNNASALFFAVMAGDVETARALVDAGTKIDQRMKVLGTFMQSPLNYATFLEGSAMVEYLISKGANPNEVDDDKISMLAWATIANRVSTVQMLLERGAQLNPVDRFGMTPVLYAASINYGDTVVMEKLIAAGADTSAKTKEGLTAFDLARTYHHEAMMKLLAAKTAVR